MTEIRTDLETWCETYITAFERFDASAIAEHWAFPALTTQAGRSFAFKSAEHFATNTEKLLGFYKRQGVASVEREVLSHYVMGENAVAMTVADKMRNSAGNVLAGWQAAYVMQRTESVWRAVAAIADGEVAAWAARGTPFGS